MNGKSSVVLHASSVAFEGQGLLILGPSGAGKSGLALELMSLGASLISDDQTVLNRRLGVVIASAPQTIRGQIEARGIGILAAVPAKPTPIRLVVDLGKSEPERLPAKQSITLLETEIDLILGAEIANLGAAIMLYLTGGRLA